MAQRSKSRFVWWGIRLICWIAILVFAFLAYMKDGHVGLISIGSSVVLGVLLSYPTRQGEKLAKQNMKKFGLEPDRDEGPASL